MQKITLRKNQERRIKSGHPWVFSNEIDKLPSSIKPGESVIVVDSRGYLVGSGFYNPRSLIAVRIYSKSEQELDLDFIKSRISAAARLRQSLYPGSSHYRLVYGESDGLPGLIVDRYGDQLVMEIMSLGMDQRREIVVQALKDILSPSAVYERSDSYSRVLEGLRESENVLYGQLAPETVIEENGLKFSVNLKHGQKTGWFYDQRDNRLALRQYVKGRTVLDCFCHTGGFAINAAAGGAKSVLGLDISDRAVDCAIRNAGLNNLAGTCRFESADVLQTLKQRVESGEKYEVVILDPPAFAKNKKSIEAALKGYKEINLRAMKLLVPGGILVSCSCSYHIEDELFKVMLVDAARDAGRILKLLEFRHQSKDHPVLLACKETQYLKCAIMVVE
jgi:23S rRNA (cytosine1962-C5)-methyltransferase